MTGPEHYEAAESVLEFLDEISENPDNPEVSAEGFMLLLARAQLHATLALAAATALGNPEKLTIGTTMKQLNDWVKVAGE